MGGENCESRRSWVDDIYWTHFHFIHFAQFLHSDYDQQLALPKRFSDNLKKLAGKENVALRGPGGAMWNIGLTTRDDTLYFARGWQKFVKDNSLEENDFLVFRYNGESQFDVLIFDRASFCEKVASYFVRKCGHTEHGSECLNKLKDTDNPLEEVNTPSNAGVECASPEKSVHGNSISVPAFVPYETTTKKALNAGVECAPVMDVDGVTVPAVAPSQTTLKRTRKQVSAVNSVPAFVPYETTTKKALNAGVECAPVMDVDGVTVPAIAPSQTTLKRTRKQVSAVNSVPAFVPYETTTKKALNTSVECAPVMDVDGVIVPAIVPFQTTLKRTRKQVSAVKHVQTKRRGKPRCNARGGGINWVPDSEPASVGRSGRYEASYTSNRRHVTEKEIKNALRLAQAACTNDSFVIVMRPTHVYKRFYVSIPVKWTTEHLSPRSQVVILRMGKSEWHVRYSFNQARHVGGLTGTWKHFAVDNNLEEFDVCLFKPTDRINNLLIMDVNIFRVVEEVTPLSKNNSGRKKVIKAIHT